MDAKEDRRHLEKVRSASERTIDSAAGHAPKRSVAKTELKTPARFAGRTMTGKRH